MSRRIKERRALVLTTNINENAVKQLLSITCWEKLLKKKPFPFT
jgi:hypothetical protein